MFTCRACMRRAIVSILEDSPATTKYAGQPRSLSYLRRPQSTNSFSKPALFTSTNTPSHNTKRQHSTIQSIRQGHHRKLLIDELKKKKPVTTNIKRKNRTLTVVEERDLNARLNNASHLNKDNDEMQLAKRASYEVQFLLGDPLELATAVLSKLRDGNFPMALELVRASEKGPKPQPGEDLTKRPKVAIDNVVSWNHLMDWLMEQGDTATALKTYNEMKKRGHKPDSYTYTIMLSGFSRYTRKPNAVKDAVKVYDSINAANSIVKPNIIHANAILNVCARGGDLDALWSIAGRLPERGIGAPNAWTYTIILNAVRQDAEKRAAKVKAIDGRDTNVDRVFDDAINDAKKMWREIVNKWQKGDLKIDEQLVCAMGRLLLASNKHADAENVYDLVGQSMNVKIDKQALRDNVYSENDVAGQRAVSNDSTTALATRVVDVAQSTNTEAYAVPGNNTLSMLIEATTVTRQTHIGKAFWDVLTRNEHGFSVEPDNGSITAYLRLLRLSRASKMTLDLLRQEWPAPVAQLLFASQGTFVIAMSTCSRDKNNPNVFDTAGRILDLMQDKAVSAMQTTDPRTIRMPKGQILDLHPKVLTIYLSLAMATPRGYDARTPLGQYKGSKMDLKSDPRWDNLLRALKRLGADVVNISQLTKLKITEAEQSPSKSRSRKKYQDEFIDANQVGNKIEDLVGLLKGMTSAYDRVLAANYRLQDAGLEPLDKQFMEDCRLQKRKISSLLSKVDDDIVKQTGRSGLWEGYDPAQQATEGAATDTAEDNSDDQEFTKTTGSMRINRAAWREQKTSENQQENRRLSRRQVQEKERDRRAERNRKVYTPLPRSATARRRSGPDAEAQRKGTHVQSGWGGGFETLVKKNDPGQLPGLVEL